MESSITTPIYDSNGDEHRIATTRKGDETDTAWMDRHKDDIAAAIVAFPLPAPPPPEE